MLIQNFEEIKDVLGTDLAEQTCSRHEKASEE